MNVLEQYLSDAGESLSGFAVRIGRSPSTLSRVVAGRRDASLELARDVERGTSGKVSAIEFLDLCLKATPFRETAMSEEVAR